MKDKKEDEIEAILGDKLILLKTNEDIKELLLDGLDLDKIKEDRCGGGGSRIVTVKNRKRMIDKEKKVKRNIFHNKVMRRY